MIEPLIAGSEVARTVTPGDYARVASANTILHDACCVLRITVSTNILSSRRALLSFVHKTHLGGNIESAAANDATTATLGPVPVAEPYSLFLTIPPAFRQANGLVPNFGTTRILGKNKEVDSEQKQKYG